MRVSYADDYQHSHRPPASESNRNGSRMNHTRKQREESTGESHHTFGPGRQNHMPTGFAGVLVGFFIPFACAQVSVVSDDGNRMRTLCHAAESDEMI